MASLDSFYLAWFALKSDDTLTALLNAVRARAKEQSGQKASAAVFRVDKARNSLRRRSKTLGSTTTLKA
jgi:hypothetical protein